MTELCEVVITAPDPDWLKDFSRKLVEQRLCASAHNFAPVRSIYRWRGEIYERTEGRVSLHTRRDRVAEIVALAKQEHPYEVPGISTRTITDGNPDYLAWISRRPAPMDSAGKKDKEETSGSEPPGQRRGGPPDQPPMQASRSPTATDGEPVPPVQMTDLSRRKAQNARSGRRRQGSR